jgi:hypothetical protein
VAAYQKTLEKSFEVRGVSLPEQFQVDADTKMCRNLESNRSRQVNTLDMNKF